MVKKLSLSANPCYPPATITTFDDIRDAVLHLPKEDQMRLLSLVALEVADAHPGIDSRPGVCGGSARIIRTRIPIWLLEALRRNGRSEAELLADYPTLTAEDLTNARNYARSHREEMDRQIAANGDDT
jgi:uncharacterized protein (DUF433 family)